jgi:hypothetical protein
MVAIASESDDHAQAGEGDLSNTRPPPIDIPNARDRPAPVAPSPSRGRPRPRSAGRRRRCPARRQRPGGRLPTPRSTPQPGAFATRPGRSPTPESLATSNARAAGLHTRPPRRRPRSRGQGCGRRGGQIPVTPIRPRHSSPRRAHPGQGHLRLTPASTAGDRSTVSDDLDPATAEAGPCGGRPQPARPESGPMAMAIDHLVGPRGRQPRRGGRGRLRETRSPRPSRRAGWPHGQGSDRGQSPASRAQVERQATATRPGRSSRPRPAGPVVRLEPAAGPGPQLAGKATSRGRRESRQFAADPPRPRRPSSRHRRDRRG